MLLLYLLGTVGPLRLAEAVEAPRFLPSPAGEQGTVGVRRRKRKSAYIQAGLNRRSAVHVVERELAAANDTDAKQLAEAGGIRSGSSGGGGSGGTGVGQTMAWPQTLSTYFPPVVFLTVSSTAVATKRSVEVCRIAPCSSKVGGALCAATDAF